MVTEVVSLFSLMQLLPYPSALPHMLTHVEERDIGEIMMFKLEP